MDKVSCRGDYLENLTPHVCRGDSSSSCSSGFSSPVPPREIATASPLNAQKASLSPPSPQILHQRQRLQLCLLHSLNNLFQGEATFSQSELNRIAINLSDALKPRASPLSRFFSSHHNFILGNYDANVLIAAAQSRGAEVVWYDRRKASSDLNLNPDENFVGLILNHPSDRFAGLWKPRHWTALRKIGDVWYDLDSYLPAPSPFLGGEDEVKQFLRQSIAGGSEVFFVSKIPKSNSNNAIGE